MPRVIALPTRKRAADVRIAGADRTVADRHHAVGRHRHVARRRCSRRGRTATVEVVAWYPAAASSGATAPYLRDGMEEVLSFARLAKLGDAFDGLASVKTHAVIDAAAGHDARRASR